MVEWRCIATFTDAVMIFLGFFMLVTGYGMTAGFMERSMALLFHVGFEKWAFMAVMVIYFLVSELGLKSYRCLYRRENTTRVWMGSLREISAWGMLATVAVMMATGLSKAFWLHKEIDGIFLGLLLMHAFSGFWFYMRNVRKLNC